MIDPIQIFLLSEMNYSSEETLRIEIPECITDRTGQEFSVIETYDTSHIKSLIIQQADYDRYEAFSCIRLVIIPETISKFVAVETIKINACIEELPVELSKLTNLKLLDLTGCYNLLSIPEAILEMKDLKIKIGDIISKASEILFIEVPLTGITQEVFSEIRSAKETKIEQLIIRQVSPDIDDEEEPEAFEVPDEIKELHELKMLCITGNVSSLPSGIGNLHELMSLTLSDCENIVSLPESIGNLSNLTSLDLTGCSKLVSLPKSIENLSHLTSFDLSNCCNLELLPSSMASLTELRSLRLSGQFTSVPLWVCTLEELTSLSLYRCTNLFSLLSSIENISQLIDLSMDLFNRKLRFKLF